MHKVVFKEQFYCLVLTVKKLILSVMYSYAIYAPEINIDELPPL